VGRRQVADSSAVARAVADRMPAMAWPVVRPPVCRRQQFGHEADVLAARRRARALRAVADLPGHALILIDKSAGSI